MLLGANSAEHCAICGCPVHRHGDYARPTLKGRSHATAHHYVAERFFGRSSNRKDLRERVFERCPWGIEGMTEIYCYECHEELLHNPVFTPEDIRMFAEMVQHVGLSEAEKPPNRIKIAGRIELLHRVIHVGLRTLRKTPDAGILT